MNQNGPIVRCLACRKSYSCSKCIKKSYMTPKYTSESLFSIKSGVFSFGVLLLEIVSGKRNMCVHQYDQCLYQVLYQCKKQRNAKEFPTGTQYDHQREMYRRNVQENFQLETDEIRRKRRLLELLMRPASALVRVASKTSQILLMRLASILVRVASAGATRIHPGEGRISYSDRSPMKAQFDLNHLRGL